jgi:hypothetical protein
MDEQDIADSLILVIAICAIVFSLALLIVERFL